MASQRVITPHATQPSPLAALEAIVAKCETKTQAAKRLGISAPYLRDLLMARRDFSPRMLAKLGFKRVVVRA